MALRFAPDGKTLYSAEHGGTLRFWDVALDKERSSVAVPGGLFGLAVSPDGKTLASAGRDGVVRLWDVVGAREIRSLKGHAGAMSAVSFSPDGKTLASAGYDRTVRIWDTDSGQSRSVLKGHSGKVTAVAFAPDGKTLASAGIGPLEVPGILGLEHADQIHLWDLAKEGPPRRLDVRGHQVAFGPDGRTLFAAGIVGETTRTPQGINLGGGPRTIVWDLHRNKERFRLTEHWLALDVSADGRFLATGWGQPTHYGSYMSGKSQCVGAHVWDAVTGQEVWRVELGKTQVTALAFSPDGRRLAIGGADGTIKFHELKPEGWQAANPLTAKELDRAWEDLAGGSKAAYAALWTLTAAEGRAVDFLKERLRAAAAARPPLAKLLADLDSPKFNVRDDAFRKLAGLGNQIESELERALKANPTAETQRRLEKLLAQAGGAPAPERLREGRALAVLERIATPAARDLLKSLAESDPRTPLTEPARAALARLARRCLPTE
jgi:WD40 repeat protein